jgi:hypothetical protein
MSWKRPSTRFGAAALTLLAVLSAATILGVAAGGAAAPRTNTYEPHTPAHVLWAIEATMTAQRDALPAGKARSHLDRALLSLHWALADVRWTGVGFLVDGSGGANALRDLRTTIGRMTWVDAKAAYEQDVVAIAGVIGDIAHHRYDDVSLFAGESTPSPVTRARLLAAGRDLRVGDAAGDRVHAASTYTRVWQRLAGLAPCCSISSPTLLGEELPGTNVDYNPAGLAEAFLTKATATGAVTRIRVYVGPDSAATSLVAGIYADDAGSPGALLAQGRLDELSADEWNVVPLSSDVPVAASSSYWVALLSPDGAGTVRFRDNCCGGSERTEISAESDLSELPVSWSSGRVFRDGPPAAYGLG